MPGGESLSSRFDYLLEPLDVDEPTADPSASDPSVTEKPLPSTAPVTLAFAAFILATLGAATALALLLAHRPEGPADPADAPLEPARLSTTAPDVAPPLDPVPPAQTASEVPSETLQPIEADPAQATAPATPPTSSNRAPERATSDAPTTRALISVAPETRQPFPNQGPRNGSSDGGGLLPGVGLPGPL